MRCFQVAKNRISKGRLLNLIAIKTTPVENLNIYKCKMKKFYHQQKLENIFLENILASYLRNKLNLKQQ